MKLLISTGLFSPSKLGGPSKTLYWLAKGLIEKGVDVSVVTTNNFIQEGTVKVDEWTYFNNVRIRYCKTKSKLQIKVIYHSIKELLVSDVILLSSVFYIPSFFIALFAVITFKKIIWSPRGELFDSAINGSKAKRSYLRLLKLLFSNKIIFHATSIEEREIMKKKLGYSLRTIIIPNYLELHEKIDRRKNSDKYFLYVGRIAPIKALDNLFLGLAKSELFVKSDFKLLIAGGIEVQFREYYKKLIQILADNKNLEGKIVFLGNIEGEQKYQLFANAYFSILVSHSENFGNVVIESLSQGTPVIASKGTPWRRLQECNSGFWIYNDEEEIARCINKVVKIEKEEYQQMRYNAYDFAKEFDVHKNIENWINVIK